MKKSIIIILAVIGFAACKKEVQQKSASVEIHALAADQFSVIIVDERRRERPCPTCK